MCCAKSVVSFHGKNYAIRCPLLIKITRQGITIDKKIMRQGIMWKGIFRVLLNQWLSVKLLCDRVYFWGTFYATEYRVWRDLPHTPVTFLMKYTPPHPGEQMLISLSMLCIKSIESKTLYNYSDLQITQLRMKLQYTFHNINCSLTQFQRPLSAHLSPL